MTDKEYITIEEGSVDVWICLCGNQSHLDGFWPCDANGNGVSPDIDGPWDGSSHVCGSCGRIFTTPTMEVIGQNPNPILLDEF